MTPVSHCLSGGGGGFATTAAADSSLILIGNGLGRIAGRLGPLAGWSERIRHSLTGGSRKSHLPVFVELLHAAPVISGALVARSLRITERAARNLIDQAVVGGFLLSLTSRRSYRLWAVPELARLIEAAPAASRRLARRAETREEPRRIPDDQEYERRILAIYDELDLAMADIDKLLSARGGQDGSQRGSGNA